MLSETRNVQGGISCGYYKRRTSPERLGGARENNFQKNAFCYAAALFLKEMFLFPMHVTSSRGTTTKTDKKLSEIPVLLKRFLINVKPDNRMTLEAFWMDSILQAFQYFKL